MPTDLTPDEIAFFETGELPPGLVPEAAADDPAAPQPTAEPAPAAPATPEPAPEVKEPVPAPEAAQPDRIAAVEAQLANLARLLEQRAAPAPEPKPEPEPGPNEDEDPLGAMMHQLKTVNATVAELQTKLTQEQQNNLMKQQFEQFTGSVTRLKQDFEKSTPDFNDAYAHIRGVRTEDLRVSGVPESDIPKILLQDELQLAQAAIGRGKNPAEEMYTMAKRYGYTPKQAAAPATPAAGAAPNAAQKLAQIQQGQAAAKHPDKAAPLDTAPLTIDGLKDVSNSDLTKLVQDDAQWNKIVGGRTEPDIF